jgi:hypothetical protein
VYGEAKSKVMKPGKRGEKIAFKLGERTLEYTDKYKYLGQMSNEKKNADDHLKDTKSKSEAAFQIAQIIAGNHNFNGIEMETFWELIETCVIPVITYSGATWNLNKKDTNEFNKILDRILKRTLMVPPSTPRETLYMETGLLDVETINIRNRVAMQARLERNPNHLTDQVTKNHIKNGWTDQNTRIMELLGITPADIKGKRTKVKTLIDKRTQIHFKKSIEERGREKSKVAFLKQGTQEWTPGRRPEYMSKLPRLQASTIFKARTRMLAVKNNYRGMFSDIICRKCGSEQETQEHILEKCKTIHKDNSLIVTKYDIFKDFNMQETSRIASKIDKVMELVLNQQ